MKKEKILTIIIVIVGILILGQISNIIKTLNTKNNPILEVKEINGFNNKDKSLAIMVQNEEEGDFGWHEAEDRSSWPDKTKYTYVGTECTDSEGATIESTEVLTFDESDYTAHIKTKDTIYCTLYFAKGRPPMEVLTQYKNGANNVETFKTDTAYNGIYMYKGEYTQVTNNYICFGTNNTDTCTASDTNKDKYLYRIIGITNTANTSLDLEAGQLKIIKATPSSTSMAWGKSGINNDHSYCGQNTAENGKCRWEAPSNAVAENKGNHAGVQIYLNGSFLNTIEEEWQKVISSPKWYIGDRTNAQTSGTETTPSTANYKVGLMYVGDYYNSWTYSSGGNTNSWLHIIHGRSGVEEKYKSNYEWTMTRYGYYKSQYWDMYEAWRIHSGGQVVNAYLDETHAVRPVFYLDPNISLVGEGTEEKPFIITSMPNNS